jgi:hypothetical protein
LNNISLKLEAVVDSYGGEHAEYCFKCCNGCSSMRARSFGGNYRLRLQSRNNKWDQQKLSLSSYSVCFSFTLIFYLEDGGDMFLRNFGLSPNYTASHIRRSYSKYLHFWLNLSQMKRNEIKYVLRHHVYAKTWTSFFRGETNLLINKIIWVIYQWLYSPLLGPGLFFSFVIFFYTERLLGRVVSSSQGRYLHTEQHEHRINAHTDIHASSRIRTHDPSFRASEDTSCLRQRGLLWSSN